MPDVAMTRAQCNSSSPTSARLPPYSPDLNPMKPAFAKLKTPLRKANARTIEDSWKSIGRVLDEFIPTGRETDRQEARLGSAQTRQRPGPLETIR